MVHCGTYIQYAFISKEFLENRSRDKKLEFKKLDIQLKPETTIYRVWGTQYNNVIQIIGEDTTKHVVFVINWDVRKNHEVNMFQVKCEHETYPQNYIVRGMNARCNYFID